MSCIIPQRKRRGATDQILGLVTPPLDARDQDGQSPFYCAIVDFNDIKDVHEQSVAPDVVQNSVAAANESWTAAENSSWRTYEPSFPRPVQGPGHDGANCPIDEEFLCYEMLSFNGPQPQVTPCRANTELDLPRYISPLSDDRAPEDIEHLYKRGALSLPNPSLRDELLRSYATWVHPFTPMLNLEEIFLAVQRDDGSRTVSLLLFQSMMFAASAFIDSDMGYGSRKRARRTYFERARLLHDLDVESDHLVVLQAALLLSLWDETLDVHRDSYYWIGIAISHANRIGLNAHTQIQTDDLPRQHMLRRTWWSLAIRDSLLAVAMRRPPQIKFHSFDVPNLQLEDFDQTTPSHTLGQALGADALGPVEMETLATLCMALSQLSEYINQVLATQYSVKQVPGRGQQTTLTASLAPKGSGQDPHLVIRCGQELQGWYESLPVKAQHCRCSGGDFDEENERAVVKVHKALLAGFFLMTLSTLYRPHLSRPVSGPTDLKLHSISRVMVFRTAMDITDILSRLHAEGWIGRLPVTALAVLESAAVTHLVNSQSQLSACQLSSSQSLPICLRMMDLMRETYFAADVTMSMLATARERLKRKAEEAKTATTNWDLDGYASDTLIHFDRMEVLDGGTGLDGWSDDSTSDLCR